jgi:patatin-like phospholipase/acyl hydrolase
MIAPADTITTQRPLGRPFQILALSGGGFRGLYTAKIVADLEEASGKPFASHFDLIAGTSVGGILALALALEIPAARIVDLFEKNGAKIFCKRWSLLGIFRAPYSSDGLRALLAAEDLFGRQLLGACKHPVIIPSINYSTGEGVLFKTAHHPDLRRDHRVPLVDVALATSAAPAFFPRHRYANSQYVDGGLFANAPGTLALHEATQFFARTDENVHLMSIGTMSSRFTVDARRRPTGGHLDWGGGNVANAPKRLFGLAISVQETLSYNMLAHRLRERYVHIDDDNSDERARAVALDKTDAAARQVLLGTAEQRSKRCISDARVREFMQHTAPNPTFFHQSQTTG